WGRGATLRDRVVTAMTEIAAYEYGIAAHYYGSVRQIPGVTVWGPDFATPHRAPTVSITMDGISPLEIAKRLGEEGLQVWEGSFYAIRAVEVLGLAATGGVVRTGICMYNLREEVDRVLEALHGIAAR